MTLLTRKSSYRFYSQVAAGSGEVELIDLPGKFAFHQAFAVGEL